MVLLWLVVGVSLGCESDASVSRLADAVVDAYRLDKNRGGAQAMVALEAHVGCLAKPLVGGDVAKVHRAFGLHASVVGSLGAARRYFNAAKIQDGAWGFPESEQIIWQPYADVAGLEVLTRQLESDQLTVLVDGSPVEGLPGNRPFVIQAYGPDGRFYHSGMYGIKTPYTDLTGPNLITEKRAFALANTGLVVGVVGVAVAAGSIARSAALNENVAVSAGLPLGSSMALAGVLVSSLGFHAYREQKFSNSVNKVVE